MNTEKILGFVLLGVGVAIILYSLSVSYMIFTGSNDAPALFSASPGEKSSLQDLQNQLPDILRQQLQGLLPQDLIPEMLNLVAWSVLAGLLIFGGAQIAGLGIKLVK